MRRNEASGSLSLLELARFREFVSSVYPAAAHALPRVTWAGLSASELVDTQVRDTVVFEAIENVMLSVRDPSLPIRFAQQSKVEHLGVLGFLLQTSADGRESLARLIRFHALSTTSGHMAVHEHAGHVCLEWHRARQRSLGVRVANEIVLAQMVGFARQLGAPRALAIHLRHAAPNETAEHAKHFQAPIHWGSTRDAVEWPSSLLTQKLPLAERAVSSWFAAEAERRLQARGQNTTTRLEVSNAVAVRLASGTPTLEEIAAALGCSSRVLQRRLRDEGCTLRDVIDETRRERAEEAKRAGVLSMTELAFALGFSELSALSRAWRRWFGASARSSKKQR